MSKRHQASRRKAYGRRQHELRAQRYERQHLPERVQHGSDELDESPAPDPFSFLDPRTPRLRFAID